MMKKLVTCLALACVLTVGITAKADVADKLINYVPNRLLDLSDVINLSVGFGPVIRLEARATRFVGIGAGVGASAEAIKGANRQYGGALENGWDCQFICVAAENTDLDSGSRWLKDYWYHSVGMPMPDEKIYNLYTGERDFWGIGFKIGALFQLGLEVCPVECADFVAGLFFIDLKGDDFGNEDIDY